jgi:hypothetical protein
MRVGLSGPGVIVECKLFGTLDTLERLEGCLHVELSLCLKLAGGVLALLQTINSVPSTPARHQVLDRRTAMLSLTLQMSSDAASTPAIAWRRAADTEVPEPYLDVTIASVFHRHPPKSG